MTFRISCSVALLLAGFSHAAHGQGSDNIPGAEITFLDVGQGDAILIRSDTFNVLIDAGGNGVAAATLVDRGIHRLHFVFASHNHRDHIGGMDEVIETVDVGGLVDNGCYVEDSESQKDLDEAIGDHQVSYATALEKVFTLGALSLTVVPSPFPCDSSQNNLSVGVLVRLGTFTALFTGDSEVDELNAWLALGLIPDVDLLKAAHHGARNGVTPGWIQATRPELVVISAGQANSYGHPHESALRYYQTGGRRVLRTDLDGAIGVCIRPTGAYEVQEHLDTSESACR